MIYSTGRSGSTLLTRVFNQLDGVKGVSEPDTPAAFVHQWPATGRHRTQLQALLDASVRVQFRTPTNDMPRVCVLKLRSEAMHLAELFQATYPQAKNLFAYRNAVGFVGSFYRIFKRVGWQEHAPVSEVVATMNRYFSPDATHLLQYLDQRAATVSLAGVCTLWWLSVMEYYLDAAQRGLPMLTVDFDDLTNHPRNTLETVVAHCDVHGANLDAALEAFRDDAQAGTIMAQEAPGEERFRLTPPQIAEVRTILARHPTLNPDYTPPTTSGTE